jgi:hypothetical protein
MEGSIMADLRASGLGGVPKGTTDDRPASPSVGDVFYNGTLGCLEIYTAAGWYAASAPMATPTIGTATDIGTGRSYSTTGGAATISFTQNSGGGLPNTFTATSNPSNITAQSTTSPITVTGLAPGTSYTFTIAGNNNFGTSSNTNASNSITATTVPQAPTIGTPTDVYLGNTVSLTFTAGNSGGLSISNYKYSTDGTTYTAFSPAQTTSPLTITGLTNGTAYTFRLKAVNANGDSVASSASSSVTPTYSLPVESLIVAGGGGGGGWVGGGGGAGGIVYNSLSYLSSGVQYSVTVGAGGNRTSASTSGYVAGTNGLNSTFNNFIAIGGGVGGTYSGSAYLGGANGGSGGGGTEPPGASGGSGTQPSSQSGGYGNNGGTTSSGGGGSGGGGAGAAGSASSNGNGGNGGNGLNTWSTWASVTSSGSSGYYAGGGGGGSDSSAGNGGLGGGGAGTKTNDGQAFSGTSNTGGGGGGARNSGGPATNQGGAGGSGIVIIRYLDTYPDVSSSVNGTKYTSGGYKYYKFNNTGSITF